MVDPLIQLPFLLFFKKKTLICGARTVVKVDFFAIPSVFVGWVVPFESGLDRVDSRKSLSDPLYSVLCGGGGGGNHIKCLYILFKATCNVVFYVFLSSAMRVIAHSPARLFGFFVVFFLVRQLSGLFLALRTISIRLCVQFLESTVGFSASRF